MQSVVQITRPWIMEIIPAARRFACTTLARSGSSKEHSKQQWKWANRKGEERALTSREGGGENTTANVGDWVQGSGVGMAQASNMEQVMDLAAKVGFTTVG